MSIFSDSLISDVQKTLRTRWTSRSGLVIPSSTDIQLGNDRVILDVVMLYADLADSTELAFRNKEIAAEVYKAYLNGVTKIIRSNGGEIRSFDGDRVMGVFLGAHKNTVAAKCGLQINWFFSEVLIPNFKSFYSSLADFPFAQTVGIDGGPIHVARGGVHKHNDLIWIGRAPNIAAKLSSIRHQSMGTLITQDVFCVLHDSSKQSVTGEAMWQPLSWVDGQPYGVSTVYGSNWYWRP